MDSWLLYGAYGFTGRLVAEEAAKRGLKPILAGRDPNKLRPLSERLGLSFRVAALDAPKALDTALEGIQAVLNTAGPFVQTAEPLIKTCLEKRVHYLDITGEIPVFQKAFQFDGEARERSVALIPGVGFDVVPTDCLAAHVHQRLPEASRLKLAIAGLLRPSRGTLKTMLGFLPQGGWVRKNGQLESFPLGEGKERIRFPHKTLDAYPIPWGDLETAWRTTGIPNITTYMALPGSLIGLGGLGIRLSHKAAKSSLVRRVLMSALNVLPEGPDEKTRQTGHGYAYAKVERDDGKVLEAWLETPETYRFTALSCLASVGELFRLKPMGALTPALAFGKDFALKIEGVKRYDTLP
jgi:short subunit dehydrogenase-like uncharacterized protein